MGDPLPNQEERLETKAVPDCGPLGDVKILNVCDSSYTDTERIGGYDVSAQLFDRRTNGESVASSNSLRLDPVVVVNLQGPETVCIPTCFNQKDVCAFYVIDPKTNEMISTNRMDLICSPFTGFHSNFIMLPIEAEDTSLCVPGDWDNINVLPIDHRLIYGIFDNRIFCARPAEEHFTHLDCFEINDDHSTTLIWSIPTTPIIKVEMSDFECNLSEIIMVDEVYSGDIIENDAHVAPFELSYHITMLSFKTVRLFYLKFRVRFSIRGCTKLRKTSSSQV
jgi:hypothetical protein